MEIPSGTATTRWRRALLLALCAVVGTLAALPAPAAHAALATLYKSEDSSVKLNLRVSGLYTSNQRQWSGRNTSNLTLDSFRPGLDARLGDWRAVGSVELAPLFDPGRTKVKSLYLRYSGVKRLKLYAGNFKTPYSRQGINSTAEMQTADTNFTGARAYGTPDRILGAMAEWAIPGKLVTLSAGAGQAVVRPDTRHISFESPLNSRFDDNLGTVTAGRVSIHPRGQVDTSQTDFERKFRIAIEAGMFTWSNDGSNNLNTPFVSPGVAATAAPADVDTVDGSVLDLAVRGGGWSVDAAWSRISATTVDPLVGDTAGFGGGVAGDGWLYVDGATDITNTAVQGGYLFPGDRVELAAAYETQDATGYEDVWTRTSLFLNVYFKQHDQKLQIGTRSGTNDAGRLAHDRDELFLLGQVVF